MQVLHLHHISKAILGDISPKKWCDLPANMGSEGRRFCICRLALILPTITGRSQQESANYIYELHCLGIFK